MVRMYYSSKCAVSLFLICFSSFLMSCGRSSDSSSAQHDDIESTSTIMYSAGWGKSTSISVELSDQITSENQANPSFQEIRKQFQFALDKWNVAIGRTVLTLSPVGTSKTADTLSSCAGISERLYYPLCNSFNGIFYDRVSSTDVINPQSEWTSGWAYNTGKSASILATTIWATSGENIKLASIRFNRDNYVFGDSTLDTNLFEDGTLKTLVDLQSVALHELGHVLGLGHNSEVNSIMYPSISIGPDQNNLNYQSSISTVKRILSTCDLNRIQYIYNNKDLLTECK